MQLLCSYTHKICYKKRHLFISTTSLILGSEWRDKRLLAFGFCQSSQTMSLAGHPEHLQVCLKNCIHTTLFYILCTFLHTLDTSNKCLTTELIIVNLFHTNMDIHLNGYFPPSVLKEQIILFTGPTFCQIFLPLFLWDATET